MSQFQEVDTTTLAYTTVSRAFEEVKNADFILHNTVQELEPHTLSALNQNQPTYAIGPINFSTDFNAPNTMLSQVDCTNWLASRPPASVLYVSFGSVAQTNREVIHEMARGLLLSEVSFIWAIRPRVVSSDGDDDARVLPVGFENDVGDRGLVVPWCNQLAVLSSPAVGGFLTHCGWNSILESIWCGVPMICYPIVYDQPTNRKVVVDDWKIGINLCDGGSVNREEVGEKVKKMMMRSGETWIGIENEMKKVRSKLQEAWAEDGSSNTNLDLFLKDLNHKMQEINSFF